MKISTFFSILFLWVPSFLNAQIISIDPAFGSDGFITYPVLPDYYGIGMELYNDGRILLFTELSEVGYQTYKSQRFLQGGTLDNSWGFNGTHTFNSGNDYDYAWIADVEVLSNDDVIFLLKNSYHDFDVDHENLLMFSFDEASNENYGVSEDYFWQGDDSFYALEDTGNGAVRVSGEYVDNFGTEEYTAAINYNSSGSQEYNNGIFLSGPVIYHTATQPGGTFYLATNFGVARKLSYGQVDPNFGNNGYSTLPGGNSIKRIFVQNDGKILAATNSSVVRLHSDGSIDTNFGINGLLLFPNSTGYISDRLSFFCDGRIIYASSNGDIYQYLPDGTLNPDFGINGKYTIDYYGSTFTIRDFQLLNENSFYIFGTINSGNDMVVGRYTLEETEQDLGAYLISNPNDSGDLTETETISVAIKNYGTELQGNTMIGYQINDLNPVLESVDFLLPLQPGESFTYSFSIPGNFSEVGFYTVKAYTVLDTDEAIYNDTVEIQIEHVPQLDARLHSLSNYNGCGEGIGYQFDLENVGVVSIMEATIDVLIDDVLIENFTWTGDLGAGDEVNINRVVAGNFPGTHMVTAIIETINSELDEVPLNDSITGTDIVSTLEPGQELNVAFKTDAFPAETSWEILDENGMLVISGGNYSFPNTVYYSFGCISEDGNACYTLVLEDDYGDGLNGYVHLTNVEGETLLYVNDFQDSDYAEYDFCVSCISADVNFGAVGADDPLAGSILITVEDPVGLIEYSIDGGQTYQTENLFTDLTSGVYEVQVINDAGCVWVTSIAIAECNLSANPNPTPESGLGANDGKIQLNASGFEPPMVFSIDGGQTFENSATFMDLAGGIYPVMIIDALSCVWTDTVEVYTCALTILDIQTTLETSPGTQDASILINAIDGIGEIFYSIDGGSSFQSSPLFENLAGGVYNIVVEDDGECILETSLEIYSCTLEVETDYSLETSVNANDAFILISATDGIGNLMYSIDGGQSFSSGFLFDGLAGGIYDAVVQDSLGCTWSSTIEILTCTLSFLTLTSVETEEGVLDGMIKVVATGGFGDLMYSIDGGQSFQSNPEFLNLSFGFYTVLVVDQEGCIAEQEVEVGLLESVFGLPVGVDFNYWPNPTSRLLNLEINGLSNAGKEAVFKLSDVGGQIKLVSRLSSNNNIQSVTLNDLAAGPYIWTLEVDGYLARGILIKQ